jgi:hypothetical protein
MEKFVLYVDRIFPDGTKRTVLAASYNDDRAFEDGFRLWDKIMNKYVGSTEAECSVNGDNFIGRITVQSVLELQKPENERGGADLQL